MNLPPERVDGSRGWLVAATAEAAHWASSAVGVGPAPAVQLTGPAAYMTPYAAVSRWFSPALRQIAEVQVS